LKSADSHGGDDFLSRESVSVEACSSKKSITQCQEYRVLKRGQYSFIFDIRAGLPSRNGLAGVILRFSWWKGARVGLFSYNTSTRLDQFSRAAYFDWFHVIDGTQSQ
jgi:hypothetical protein